MYTDPMPKEWQYKNIQPTHKENAMHKKDPETNLAHQKKNYYGTQQNLTTHRK